MKKRLSDSHSVIMKADCIILKTSSDIKTLREIVLKFPNIIPKNDFNHISNEFESLLKIEGLIFTKR